MRDYRNSIAVFLLVVAAGLAVGGEPEVPLWLSDNCAECPTRIETQTGVYILENMDTRALAADGVSEFLFVLGQPRFVGAVQAVINPVAIR